MLRFGERLIGVLLTLAWQINSAYPLTQPYWR